MYRRVTRGLKKIQRDTGGYSSSQGLEGFTTGYKAKNTLQRVTRGFKGLKRD